MGSKLRIKERLVKAFRRVLMIASVAAVVGVIALIVVNSQYASALINYGFSQGDIGKAATSFVGTRAYMLAAIGYDDEADMQSAIEGHDAMKEKFVNTYWPEVENTLTTKAEKESYAALSEELENYWTLEAEVMSKGTCDNVEEYTEAQKVAAQQLEPIYNDVYQQLADLMSTNVVQGDRLSDALSILCWILVAVVLAVIVGTSIYAARLGANVAKGIADPLNALSERLSTFAKGDLSSPFPTVETQDEVADMTNSAIEMGENLSAIINDAGSALHEFSKGNYRATSKEKQRYTGDFAILMVAMKDLKAQMIETMTAIEEASSQVSAGATNLAEASQSLAEGATEQAGTVEEMQATISEITANIEKAAKSAEDAYSQAQKYAQEADNSKVEMQSMVAAMERITETSQKIGNIISEIEDIASQTNLLSLNASIEAARAGEAGRGFAVVAEQIRQLADQSAQAASNTRELIGNALSEIEEGNNAAGHVAASIDEVVQGINVIAETAKQSSLNSAEQASSMEKAEAGMNQISEVVQSNSATAEESSATSEELSAQSVTLDELIKKFQL